MVRRSGSRVGSYLEGALQEQGLRLAFGHVGAVGQGHRRRARHRDVIHVRQRRDARVELERTIDVHVVIGVVARIAAVAFGRDGEGQRERSDPRPEGHVDRFRIEGRILEEVVGGGAVHGR